MSVKRVLVEAERLFGPEHPLDTQTVRRPRPPVAPATISTDAEAIAAAQSLADAARAGAAERDRQRLPPWDLVEVFTASGLGSITIPQAYGGPQLRHGTLAEVFATISAADPSLGQIPQSHFGVLELLKVLGGEDQKRRFFDAVLAGARVGNAGPERGSKPITHVATRLLATSSGLRLSGTRFYSTGAIFAHWIPTRAADDEGRAVQVWVAHDAPGVTIVDDWSGFGQRTTASGTVIFEDVHIDAGQVFPVWTLADRPGIWGPVSQYIHAAIDLGIARGALADAVSFVRDKARPWMDSGVESAADDPTIIREFGKLSTQLAAAEALVAEAGATLDEIAAEPITAQASARASVAVAEAKVLTTEIALETTEKLFDVAGSSATRAAHDLDRHWRNARVHTLHDPVRWKLHLLGNYQLNGVLPARHQWN
ncbi:MAG: SfnB family sulfur acquisition oxidoreductase [Rhizobiaceae bacterium]|nr:SfnB family sulfur acquisition oxidoreductase [Rhizobiaceae bacterium]